MTKKDLDKDTNMCLQIGVHVRTRRHARTFSVCRASVEVNCVCVCVRERERMCVCVCSHGQNSDIETPVKLHRKIQE